LQLIAAIAFCCLPIELLFDPKEYCETGESNGIDEGIQTRDARFLEHHDVISRSEYAKYAILSLTDGAVVARPPNAFPFSNGFRAVSVTELG